MNITLIEPAMIKRPKGLSEKPIFCLEPLAPAVLAGLTPADIHVQLIDDRFDAIHYANPTDLVGISVRTFTARRAYQIAGEFHKRGIPVILGGHHVSLQPEEASQYADSIFIGEAETLWAQVLQDVSRGRLQPVYRGGREEHYPPIQIDRSIFRNKKYLPAAVVESGRGCPFNCSFCSVSTFFGHTFRRRSIGQLVDEIRSLHQKTILFADDNIVGDIQTAKELFTALVPLKIRWMSQASISMTRDPELMDLMRKSGCAGLLVGIESLFSDNLQDLRKGWNIAYQDYIQALQIVRQHNIALVGSFIVGLDNDTNASLDATLKFAIQQKLFAVLFNMLIPFPGTGLYTLFQQETRLRYDKWWLDERYRYGQAVFQPKHFSAAGIEQKRMEMYRKFYGARSIASRLLDPSSNLQDPWHALVYLAINLPGYTQENWRTGQRLGL
ncbi:MAG: radical SAM protein [Anaerolineaceae bacterium]|nr:radical SAM protein [Anaerolineaceae bacterium]